MAACANYVALCTGRLAPALASEAADAIFTPFGFIAAFSLSAENRLSGRSRSLRAPCGPDRSSAAAGFTLTYVGAVQYTQARWGSHNGYTYCEYHIVFWSIR
jgi:hypothetical protein